MPELYLTDKNRGQWEIFKNKKIRIIALFIIIELLNNQDSHLLFHINITPHYNKNNVN